MALPVDAGRWQRVKAVLHDTLGRPPAERDAFLAAACGDDATLRAEVESLLAAQDAVRDDFLETPAFAEEASALAATRAREMVGRRIDAFRVLREIGRGGMGTVYLAERADGQYEGRVALKVVSRGMDTDVVVRRFRRERQILAELDHPNVARLYGGGTTEDGLPYFVMEYVDGEPIDAYCARRALGIPGRLLLFRQVCAAVQYAHQRLVVHRDLKPGNILVTADGTPKLLDFGIAKALAGDAAHSQASQATALTLRAMTPAYASPEQAAGEPVTTLSDVYSLGVLLYELLTGRRPVFVGDEPERPSVTDARRRRQLRGDLDNIVLKAMRRDPARRYASAEQFADDLRRHAERLPVLARPDTLGYRATRFVRRHRGGVAAAAVALLALVAGTAATTYQARVARQARQRADRRFDDVRRLATTLLFDLDDKLATLSDATGARELLIDRVQASLDELAGEAGNDPALQRELAAAYARVGDAQGAPYVSNLGHTALAVGSYRKAIALLEPLVRRRPDDAALAMQLARVESGASAVQVRAGDLEGAIATQRRAVAIGERLVARAPDDSAFQRALSLDLVFYSRALYLRGSLGAIDSARMAGARAVAIRRALLARFPRDSTLLKEVAFAEAYLAYNYWRRADVTRDTSEYRVALALLTEVRDMTARYARMVPGSVKARRDAVDPLHEMAQLHVLLGEPALAVRDVRAGRATFVSLAAQDPSNLEAQRDLAVQDAALAGAYATLDARDSALAAVGRARAVLTRIRAADSTSNDDVQSLAELAMVEGGVRRRAGDVAAAGASYQAASALARRWGAMVPASDMPRRLQASADSAIAVLDGRRANR